jgi:hypothetical protein
MARKLVVVVRRMWIGRQGRQARCIAGTCELQPLEGPGRGHGPNLQ